ncbi:MAG: hypothetical protein ACTIJ9_03415 [Aequorivita sp.]
MKQKDIVINGKFSIEAEEMIYEYFATERVNGIEGFIFSEIVFYKNHQNTYAFQELKYGQYYAVYQVGRCDMCWMPFDVIINDRAHLYRYAQTELKLCLNCKGFHYKMDEIGPIQLAGDIAS